MSTLMTLDDLEFLKYGVLVNVLRFWAATHNSRVNFVEIAGTTPRYPAYEIFSIKCRF